MRRIFNELEENEPPRAGEHVLHSQHSRKESRKNRMARVNQVPVSKLETKFREEPSLATSCNSLHRFVIYFIRKYSRRTERAAESSCYASLQEGNVMFAFDLELMFL